jgi:5-methylcytosine-specific restriction endonuclease McrA
MAFSPTVKVQALRRSGGRCECRRSGHGHNYSVRCSTRLTLGTAQFHHKAAQSVGGHDGLSNCEVLCGACHRRTASYGRH